jgi:DNA repair protein NreA
MDSLCIKCKGRGFCKKKCKWLNLNFKSFDFKKDFSGSSPSIFVGKANYPNVSIGLMSLPFNTIDANNYNNPKFFTNNLSINQILQKRSLLINCNSNKKSFFEKIQELALSKKAVNIEANLFKTPKPKSSFDFVSTPMGPSSELKKFSINENIKIDKNVSKCFYDSDLKANTALNILFKKGINENDLSKYLSSGAFGIKKQRKFVPTRWSITAVDDSLGKAMICRIKDYPVIKNFMIFKGDLFGNYYTIILLPFIYGFELFETSNDSEFMHDYEEFKGRKNYAYETAGGYYASRLAVLEYLDKNKIQARIIVYRKITDEYLAPLGVWVVREAARKAMNNKKIIENKKELIKKIDFAKTLINKSLLFKKFITQKNLRQF